MSFTQPFPLPNARNGQSWASFTTKHLAQSGDASTIGSSISHLDTPRCAQYSSPAKEACTPLLSRGEAYCTTKLCERHGKKIVRGVAFL